MDGVFALPETARTDFLGSLVQSLGCAYVCLWRYDSNLLFFLDGLYNVITDYNQPSSSIGSVAQTLFHQYRGLTFDVNDDCVPGVAFRNQFPYLELQHLDLLRLASTQTQTRFFQEAGIKTVVYMGCSKGEIELGFSNMPQVDIHAILRNLFPGDFCIESQSIDQTHPTPSSSSFISLSASSPECSSLLFSTINPLITSSPLFPPETLPTHQQTIPSHYLRTPEGEHDAIIRALLHVISPPSSSTTTTSQQQQHHQNLPHSSGASTTAHAFKSYTSDNITAPIGSNFPRQSMLNRSVVFLRSLNFMRARERNINEAPRATTSAHLYHMISERRRRVKLNESFQALRALLPPGTKRDKAWILTTAKERIRCLMDEIEKLKSRNQQLMRGTEGDNSSNKRLNVVLETSNSLEERIVKLQVTVRGESYSQVDIVIRLLEFLESVQNVTFISMATNTHITQGITIHQLTFTLRIIEGSEWDECTFQEAVRRVVADLLQWQPHQ